MADIKKFGVNLQPGDVLRNFYNDICIICFVNSYKEFYKDRSHLELFNIKNCSNGTYFSVFDLNEEYNVITDKEELLKYYDQVELKLLRQSVELINFRNILIDNKCKLLERI